METQELRSQEFLNVDFPPRAAAPVWSGDGLASPVSLTGGEGTLSVEKRLCECRQLQDG